MIFASDLHDRVTRLGMELNPRLLPAFAGGLPDGCHEELLQSHGDRPSRNIITGEGKANQVYIRRDRPMGAPEAGVFNTGDVTRGV